MMPSRNHVPDNLDNIVATLGLAQGFTKVCINCGMNQAKLYLNKGL